MIIMIERAGVTVATVLEQCEGYAHMMSADPKWEPHFTQNDIIRYYASARAIAKLTTVGCG